jgi:hypothetical protein
MALVTIIITILIVITLGYIFLITIGYDNFRGITLQLDDVYTNTSEMACAVFNELRKQERECEVIEMGKGYPKFLVDGKKYLMTYKMASIYGVPMQVVHLKLYKE